MYIPKEKADSDELAYNIERYIEEAVKKRGKVILEHPFDLFSIYWYQLVCKYRFNKDGMNRAAADGETILLSWVAKKLEIYPTSIGINWAIENGHIEVVKWGFNWGIYPDGDGVISAIIGDQRKILKYLVKKGLILNPNQLNVAALWGRFKILKWCYKYYSTIPNYIGANWAAKNGYINIVKWLVNFGVKPTQEAANNVVIAANLKLVKYLFSLKIYPTSEALDRAIWSNLRKGKMEMKVVNWLAKRSIHPTNKSADLAAKYGNLKLLKWLAKLDIYPTSLGLKWAQKNKKRAVVNWINQ